MSKASNIDEVAIRSSRRKKLERKGRSRRGHRFASRGSAQRGDGSRREMIGKRNCRHNVLGAEAATTFCSVLENLSRSASARLPPFISAWSTMSDTQTASTVPCYQIKAILKFHSFSLMLLYLITVKYFFSNNLKYLSDVVCAYTSYSGWKNKISGSDRNSIDQRPNISISVRRKFAEYHRTEIPVRSSEETSVTRIKTS